MSGLRARSKQRRRGYVLEAASNLFREHGYQGTTMEEIATVAEVSIGTIYTYFGSKGGILRALITPLIEQMETKGEAVLANPPENAVDAMAALFEAHRFTDEWRHLNILRAFDPRTRFADEELVAIAELIEDFIKQQFAELLVTLRERGKLASNVDIDDAVFILYSVLLSNFEVYLLADGATPYEEIRLAMLRQLPLLFQAWA